MQVSVENLAFTLEQFDQICRFLKQLYPGSFQIENFLYLPPSNEQNWPQQIDEVARVVDLCDTILAYRKPDGKRGQKGSLVYHSRCTEPKTICYYEYMLQEQYALDVLGSGDNRSEDCPHDVQGIFDPQRKLIWFEASNCGCDDAYEWCVRQGVTYCPSIQAANERIEKLFGPEATGFFDPSEATDSK